MKVRIRRYPAGFQEFEIELFQSSTLLDLLHRIKEDIDPSLTFKSMCRAGVCGTCAVNLNGKPVLACSTWVSPQEELTIEPISGYAAIKDLVVDKETIHLKLKRAQSWLSVSEKEVFVDEAVNQKTLRSWDCILCGICDSVCPLLLNSSVFGGPLVLVRKYKHLFDPRNKEKEKALQNLYDLRPDLCTHCMNCSYACPKKLMPEALIKEEERLLTKKGLIQKQSGAFDFLSF